LIIVPQGNQVFGAWAPNLEWTLYGSTVFFPNANLKYARANQIHRLTFEMLPEFVRLQHMREAIKMHPDNVLLGAWAIFKSIVQGEFPPKMIYFAKRLWQKNPESIPAFMIWVSLNILARRKPTKAVQLLINRVGQNNPPTHLSVWNCLLSLMDPNSERGRHYHSMAPLYCSPK